MRSFVIAASLAAAVAAGAPPRIELDLSAANAHSVLYKLATPIDRTSSLCGDEVQSKTSTQEYTVKCPASTTQAAATCPMPLARAWDHHDEGSVAVTTRVYLVDIDNKGSDAAAVAGTSFAASTDSNAITCAEGLYLGSNDAGMAEIKYDIRATYLVKYDAVDRSANQAEQLVVALVMDDTLPPQIDMVCQTSGVSGTTEFNTAAVGEASCPEYGQDYIEAGSKWELSCGSTAEDHLTSGALAIDYTIEDLTDGRIVTTATDCATAKSLMNTNIVTNYLVTLRTCDDAGVYGHNHESNCASYYQTIRVRDSLKPWIDVHGSRPYYHECGKQYQDEGATCHDALDTEKLNMVLAVTQSEPPTSSSGVADYDITYDCQDAHANQADQVPRTVKVIDTRAPDMTVTSEADLIHTMDSSNAESVVLAELTARGPACVDACPDSDPTFWGNWTRNGGVWDEMSKVANEYCWTCRDNSANEDHVCITVRPDDSSKPILTLEGPPTETVEATRDGAYTDEGATCSDQLASSGAYLSNLNDRVKISGQVVNMRVPGTYNITYKCMDSAGNKADDVTREVIVMDRICPVITVEGREEMTIEAGFPYVDSGCTATDDLDGDIPYWNSDKTDVEAAWTITGDQVNFRKAFPTATCCDSIKQQMQASGHWDSVNQAHVSGGQSPHTGKYYITTLDNAAPGGGVYQRVLATCDFTGTKTDTYVEIDGTTDAVPSIVAYEGASGAQGLCPGLGLVMASATQKAAAKASGLFFSPDAANPDRFFPATAAASTDEYLCVNDASNALTIDTASAAFAGLGESTNYANTAVLGKSEPGRYVITYGVVDAHNNGVVDSCSIKKRTVTVIDTLPPVITLHLDGDDTVQQTGEWRQNSLASDSLTLKNPAGSSLHTDTNEAAVQDDYGYGNPFLDGLNEKHGYNAEQGKTSADDHDDYKGAFMAEEQASASTSAWVMGAVASAVTGMALLGYSAKKSTVTTVPV